MSVTLPHITIVTDSFARFDTNVDGCIKSETYSDDWKALSLVSFNRAGNVDERVPFNQWGNLKPYFDDIRIYGSEKPNDVGYFRGRKNRTIKTVKKLWYVEDLDHGTRRIWGKPINYLYYHQ